MSYHIYLSEFAATVRCMWWSVLSTKVAKLGRFLRVLRNSELTLKGSTRETDHVESLNTSRGLATCLVRTHRQGERILSLRRTDSKLHRTAWWRCRWQTVFTCFHWQGFFVNQDTHSCSKQLFWSTQQLRDLHVTGEVARTQSWPALRKTCTSRENKPQQTYNIYVYTYITHWHSTF